MNLNGMKYEYFIYRWKNNYNSSEFNMFNVYEPDALLLYDAAEILEDRNYTDMATTNGTEIRAMPPWDRRLRFNIRVHQMAGRPDMICIYIFEGLRKEQVSRLSHDAVYSASCMIDVWRTEFVRCLSEAKRNIERKRLYSKK